MWRFVGGFNHGFPCPSHYCPPWVPIRGQLGVSSGSYGYRLGVQGIEFRVVVAIILEIHR